MSSPKSTVGDLLRFGNGEPSPFEPGMYGSLSIPFEADFAPAFEGTWDEWMRETGAGRAYRALPTWGNRPHRANRVANSVVRRFERSMMGVEDE